jgi:glyoxylase-like metal-dependent hydrolase (beta-lactamase superfamily II)
MYATKVAEKVYMLDTFALGTPKAVAAFVVKAPKVTLFDCGYASTYRNVLSGLSEAGISPEDVRYIVPTHVHLDHAGAAGTLAKLMPNAEVVAHERSIQHLADPTRLIESATMVFGPETMRLYGLPEPVPRERMSGVGEEFSLDMGGEWSATLVHTPGHAPHQISAWLPATKMLVTADAVGIAYPGFSTLIPTTPPPSFRPDELVSSVLTLSQMNPRELLVPHFGVKPEPGWVFDSTVEKVRAWVRKVESMRAHGASLDEAAAEMEKEVATTEGRELPLYAKVSVRASVMGIMHYLSKA